MCASKPLTKGLFRYSINLSERLLRIEGDGNIELKTVTDLIDAVIEDPEFHPQLPVIVDFRKIYFHPSYDELMEIKDHLYSIKDKINNKIALVVNGDLYYIALMISISCNKFGLKMESFKNPQTAKNWVTEPTS